MTFLCTYNGRLEPGYLNGEARTVVHEGVTFYDWPQPWAFECNGCGRIFPYGCVAMRVNQRLRPPTVREIDGGGRQNHRCAYCEGWRDPGQQLELFTP